MPTVHVLAWGGGNTGSVVRALSRAGAAPVVTTDPSEVARAERLVFPGVGHFGHVLVRLLEGGFLEPLRERIAAGRMPTLGICVGMQALFASSEEAPSSLAGIGAFPGAVERLRSRKVPHTGWNEVVPCESDPHLVRGHAYFVHSYAAPAPIGAPYVAAVTEHEGALFASAVRLGPTLAVQFHPEKSGRYGAALLERWVSKPC